MMKSLKIKEEYGMSSMQGGYYPSFSIDEDAIPELKAKKVGEECELKVKVRITGLNADSKKRRYSVDVLEGEYGEHE